MTTSTPSEWEAWEQNLVKTLREFAAEAAKLSASLAAGTVSVGALRALSSVLTEAASTAERVGEVVTADDALEPALAKRGLAQGA